MGILGNDSKDLSHNKIKVLYIAAGQGRSGSTILERILGQVDGFSAVGELVHIWERGFIENTLCGCGAEFSKCEFWREVFDRGFGGKEQINAREMLNLSERCAYPRHIPAMLVPAGKALLTTRLRKFLDNSMKLYRAIHRTTGCDVIIDSSKWPSYGYLLGLMPGIDLYVLHLVRDPRGVVYSWLRTKLYQPDNGHLMYMRKLRPVNTTLRWTTKHLATELLLRRLRERYLTLRYEDFVSRPQESIRRIFDLVKERVRHLPFVGDREVELGLNHTVSGNPLRFQTGVTRIELDNEWMVKMRPADLLLVTALTWPLLIRYNYSIRSPLGIGE